MKPKKNVIDDIVTIEEYEMGGICPPLPTPEDGQLIVPCHLDRLPDEIKAEVQHMYLINEDTPQAISSWLEDKGYMVWKLKVAKWCDSSFRRGQDKTDALHTEKTRLEIERKAVYSMLAVAMESIKKMKVPDVSTPKEFEQMSGSIARLVTAMAQRERVEFDKDEGVRKAKEIIVYEIKKQLANNPDLMTQIYEIIEASSEQAKLQLVK